MNMVLREMMVRQGIDGCDALGYEVVRKWYLFSGDVVIAEVLDVAAFMNGMDAMLMGVRLGVKARRGARAYRVEPLED